jgi:hypothetical protein
MILFTEIVRWDTRYVQAQRCAKTRVGRPRASFSPPDLGHPLRKETRDHKFRKIILTAFLVIVFSVPVIRFLVDLAKPLTLDAGTQEILSAVIINWLNSGTERAKEQQASIELNTYGGSSPHFYQIDYDVWLHLCQLKMGDAALACYLGDARRDLVKAIADHPLGQAFDGDGNSMPLRTGPENPMPLPVKSSMSMTHSLAKGTSQ